MLSKMFQLCKCGVVLGRRWATLIFISSCVVLLVYDRIMGRMPFIDQVLVGFPDGTGSFAPLRLPFVIPRVADMAVGSLLLFLGIASVFTVSERVWLSVDREKVGPSLGFGIIAGVLASGVILGWSGISGAVIGTLIFGTLFSCVAVCSDKPYTMFELFGSQLAAVATIWCFSTYFQGTVGGFVYAATALVTAWVVHVVIWTGRQIYLGASDYKLTPLRDRIVLYFTSCDESACQSESQPALPVKTSN